MASLVLGYWVGVKSRPVAGEISSKPSGGNESPTDGSETSSSAGDDIISSLEIEEMDECKLVRA